MFVESAHMLGIGADRENTACDARMNRLDAAVEHFRKTSDFGDFTNGNPILAQQFRGAAG